MRGEPDRAALLREASTTLRVVMRLDGLRRAEPDVAALMEAEGIAMRPGPRPVIAPGVLPNLRRAIPSMQLVVVRYAGPDELSQIRASFAPMAFSMADEGGSSRMSMSCQACGYGDWTELSQST